jgi:regulation of enolase protein 1 (concanavalin A-like superfamily)
MKSFGPIFAILLLLSACSSPPELVTNKKTSAKPTAAVPTPIVPDAVTIEKQTNVSFSTYSTEWPVDWQWVDPDEKYVPTPHDVKKGVLRVQIPSGKNLSLESGNAPRYIKAIKGDFQIETRVRFLPRENFQAAGLLILKDNNNYMRFERAYGGIGGGGEGLRIDVRKGDEYSPIVTPSDIPTEASEVELKIVRTGRVFIAYWREDENAEWREAGEYESDYPETIITGLVACNTAREVTAEFAYIRLLPGITP